MNIIILGPQGSGKGTQGKLVAQQFGLNYVSMGDVFREAATDNEELDRTMESGKLLPDGVVMSSLQKYLEERGFEDNLVLDGVPRRISQYEALKNMLGKIDLAILLDISREETIKRLSARRQDPKTGEVYNLATSPKPPAGIDPSTLIQRDDDKSEAINKRLDEYEKDTKPLVNLLSNIGILVKVNGERSIEEIHNDLIKIIESKK